MSKNKKIFVAVIQLNSGKNKKKNLKITTALINKAVDRGAQFILLPETFNFRGDYAGSLGNAEGIPGPSTWALMDFAKKKKIWILAGSIYEKVGGSKKCYNSSVLIDMRGKIEAIYRKIHLLDVSLNRKRIQESKIFFRGKSPVLAKVMGVNVGLSICYDLRFPQLYAYYANLGVKIFCIPSSFTCETGRAHWEALLRARAIENQCFVIAPNQCGSGINGVSTYGNSMIIDPWGRILAKASKNHEEIIYAKLDLSLLEAIRKRIPVLKHRINLDRIIG